MKILYAGDSPVGGPANYLLGILRSLKASVLHVPPERKLLPNAARRKYDAIILSDYPKAQLPAASERALADHVSHGAGLLMVGGWASFSGPFGKWRGSEIEKLLPVTCLGADDRRNFPSGLFVIPKRKHPVLGGIRFSNPPVLCGLNEVRPKKNSSVVLAARAIVGAGRPQGALLLTLSKKEFPLLVADSDPKKRIAVFATDFAPHWCGGLVDWGTKRVKLSVTSNIRIEVGDAYVRFITNLIRWLAGRSS